MEPGTGRAALHPDPDPAERLVPLRAALGVTTFGINQLVLRPGQRMRVHRHITQEEVYLVLEGTLTVVLEDGEETVAVGELLRVAPELRRQLLNRGPERVALLALGGAHEHQSRDAEAFSDWDDTEPKQPRDVPLPDDEAV